MRLPRPRPGPERLAPIRRRDNAERNLARMDPADHSDEAARVRAVLAACVARPAVRTTPAVPTTLPARTIRAVGIPTRRSHFHSGREVDNFRSGNCRLTIYFPIDRQST